MPRKIVDKTYDADSIQHLEDSDHIRLRPALYLGSSGKPGALHMVKEILDNCLDEYVNGHGDRIEVNYYKDGYIRIRDYARGIPVGLNKDSGEDSLFLLTGKLNSSGKYSKEGNSGYSGSSIGTNGIGIKTVAYLSEYASFTSYSIAKGDKEKNKWTIEYGKGDLIKKVHSQGKTKEQGTEVYFKPDEEVFGKIKFNHDELAGFCRSLTYLVEGLTIHLNDEMNGKEETFYYEEGVKQYLQEILGDSELLVNAPLEIKIDAEEGSKENFQGFFGTVFFTKNGVSKNFKDLRESFANLVSTYEGGEHVKGFEMGVLQAFKDFAIQRKFKEKQVSLITARDVLFNIFYVINANLLEAQFSSQTKERLVNGDIKNVLKKEVREVVYHELLKNPQEYDKVVERALILVESRNKADEFDYAKILEDIKSENSVGKFLGKLKPPRDSKAKKKELYLVEGASGGGTIQKILFPHQGYLSLKGVPMNVEERYDYDLKKFHPVVLQNEEYRSIISALGGNILDEFIEENMPYQGGIFIANDEDGDGKFIAVELVNFFFRAYGLEFVNKYLYFINMPLYLIRHGNEEISFYNEQDKAKFIKGKNIEAKNVRRFKGLGEYNAKEFQKFAMDPETREVYKLKFEDEEALEEAFYTYLGGDADRRKEFIGQRSVDFNNLDL